MLEPRLCCLNSLSQYFEIDGCFAFQRLSGSMCESCPLGRIEDFKLFSSLHSLCLALKTDLRANTLLFLMPCKCIFLFRLAYRPSTMNVLPSEEVWVSIFCPINLSEVTQSSTLGRHIFIMFGNSSMLDPGFISLIFDIIIIRKCDSLPTITIYIPHIYIYTRIIHLE